MARIASTPGTRPAPPPEVERPHAEAWRALEAEGIRWEGQVLIVGSETDLPARLIVTRRRVALVANRAITLDIPGEWLWPEPKLLAENGVRLYITPEGASAADTEPMLLRAVAGRGAAAQLVAVLTGRPLPVEQHESATPHIVAELPAWKTTVGAAPPVALPPLPDFGDEESAPQAAWPPVGYEAVAATPRPATRDRAPGARTSWANPKPAPTPEPVPMAVSRAARSQGTMEDGVTIADEAAAAPVPTTAGQGGHRGVVWALRAAILLILVGTGAYFGRDHLAAIDANAIRDRLPSEVQRTLGIADDNDKIAQRTDGASQFGAEGGNGGNGQRTDGTGGAPEDDVAAVEAAIQTEEADGVGGTTSPLPSATDESNAPQDPTTSQDQGEADEPAEEPVEEPAPTEAPAPTEEPIPTEAPEPTVAPEPTQEPEPTAEPTAEPTQEPEPTAEPTAEPTIEPTPEPTVEPTPEPTVEPTPEPTVEPTPEPTEEPAEASTPEPSEEPTEAPTPEPTAEPTEEPTPTVAPQAPSVEPETTPEQAVVAAGFRYTIEGASVGDTVPELPDINSVGGYGEWVVLSVYGQNLTGSEQVFDMSAFRLFADGHEVMVDVGNAWVNGLAGNTPAYGNTDAILWAAGEGHRFILTFLAPPEAQSLILQAGEQQLDLTPALENPTPLLGDAETPGESDLLQGTVVDVLDGETILVDIDGVTVQVRYLGLDVPAAESCYADEAAAVNRDLVMGKTVTLERQATNTDARGNWVRDVWVENEDGLPVLVSQHLVAEGAATADISVPNTRFAGWLNQSQAQAQANGAGMWGACGDDAGQASQGAMPVVRTTSAQRES